MRQGKGQISQPLHTGRGGGVIQKSLSQEGGGPAFQGWLHLCLEWLPDCSLSDQVLPTAISQTLPLRTQCPPLREIRQVVSWRLRIAHIPQGQCNLAPHGDASVSIFTIQNAPKPKQRIPAYVPSIHLLQAPLTLLTSPLGSLHSRVQNVQGSRIGKGGVVISEKHLRRVMSSRYRKGWPFQPIISGAPGPATAQQRILDSIEAEKMTLRRGCENTGEGWSHLSPGSNGLRCEQWTGRHCLLCGGDKGLPQFRLLRSACL